MFQNKRNKYPSNIVSKLRSREIGFKKTHLYCGCQLLILHEQIQTQCCTIPYQEQIRRQWSFTRYFKYVSDTKRKFNDLFRIEFYKTLSPQISYCGYHNMHFTYNDKSVFAKKKLLGKYYYLRCNFNDSICINKWE